MLVRNLLTFRIEFEPETFNYSNYVHSDDDSDELEGPTDKIQEAAEMFQMLTSEKLVVVGPMVLLVFFSLYVKHPDLHLELRPGIEVKCFKTLNTDPESITFNLKSKASWNMP